MILAAALAILVALGAAARVYILERRARRLAVELLALAHGRKLAGRVWNTPSPRLNEALSVLSEQFSLAHHQRDDAAAKAKSAAERESARLAALLNDLHEGVVVCNLRHQVVLYNQIALKLLKVCGEMGLGRPLFAQMAIEPVQHGLDMLIRRPGGAEGHLPFMSRTHDGRSLLQGRISLVREAGAPTGYVITFDDVTAQVSALARRDALLREVMEILRGPAPETERIKAALAHAGQVYRGLLSGWWPMSDIHSPDLFEMVVARLDHSLAQVTLVGLPAWLHGDGHSLVLALEALLKALSSDTGVREFDLAAENGQIVVRWKGKRTSEESLTRWGEAPVSPSLGGMTVRDVMAHHAAEAPVMEEHDGTMSVRLTLPPPRNPPSVEEPGERGPGRPEFFDFNLLAQSRGGKRADVALRDLTYVVFDTETTGLKPSEGDRIVSLAGVRIVGGRILTGESFTRIVDPGRPIPAESTRYHGLTDALVAGKPPLEVVLPQFKDFVADAVLVAHNAAFDLKFLRMFERESGVTFDNPALDTMLLSSFVDSSPEAQSLDEICARYGVAIADRHSALGDAMATAAVFLHMIDALERRGIRTLGDALSTLDMTLQLHQRGQAI